MLLNYFFRYLLYSLIALASTQTDELFYIYDTDDWPDIGHASSTFKYDSRAILNVTINNGAGPVINTKQGLYHTDQYQLYLLMYNRALTDQRRTRDPSKATTFIIPYDFSSDIAFYRQCYKNITQTCFDFRYCPLATRVQSLLNLSPWYHRHSGHDHLVFVGFNYCMDHYLKKPKCRYFLENVCYNCTKLAIDDYSFAYYKEYHYFKGINWHAIPFPSDFHWTRLVTRPYPWEATDRPYLVSYVGSSKSHFGPARNLKRKLETLCHKHKELCIHASYSKDGSRSSLYVQGHDPLWVNRHSVFCLQPIGTRTTSYMLHTCMYTCTCYTY